MNESRATIMVSYTPGAEDEFSRDVSVSIAVAPDASIGRMCSQVVAAVKAMLIAVGYSDKLVAEDFHGVNWDEM